MHLSRRARQLERIRFLRSITLYLDDCFKTRSVARVSELADRMGRNRAYITIRAREVFGKSLKDVMRELQLARAEELLRVTLMTVDEIGLSCAFGHESTFYRVFRRAYGVSPGVFRKKATKCE